MRSVLSIANARVGGRLHARLPEARGTAMSALLLALGACSAPDGRDLFAPLPLRGDGGGGFGGFDSRDASAPAAGGSDSDEGQAGALGLAGNTGRAGDGPGVAAGLDASAADAEAADAGPALADASRAPTCSAGVEVCDGRDNDCDAVADEGATCVTECDGFTIGAGAYMFCAAAVSRAEAVGRCDLEGMRLAWIESAEEEASLITSILAADVAFPAGNAELLTHIGAADSAREGSWIWIGTASIADGFQFWQGTSVANGGAPVGGAFAHWDDLEPNDANGEDCAVMSVRGAGSREAGEWDDRNCGATFPFVCESE